MLWLTRKKIPGGLAFGSPAWMPRRIENTFDDGPAFHQPVADRQLPKAETKLNNRGALLALLQQMELSRTSHVLPGVAEQLMQLGDRPVRALALVLMPAQPEFIFGPALSALALQDLSAGLEAIQICTSPQRSMVIHDRHDFHTRRLWKAPARELKLQRIGLLNQYPQAHPTLLTRALFGRKLPVDALPSTLNLLLIDPVSCWALGRYLRTGQAFRDRPVQLFAENDQPRLVMGRIGETFEGFLQRYKIPARLMGAQVIINGMLTGRQIMPLGTNDVPTLSAMTESVSLREPVGNEPPAPCIACGWCVDVCPTALTPIHLLQLNQNLSVNLQSREARESMHCISCGLCSYVCPTRLPLMEQTLELRARVAGRERAG